MRWWEGTVLSPLAPAFSHQGTTVIESDVDSRSSCRRQWPWVSEAEDAGSQRLAGPHRIQAWRGRPEASSACSVRLTLPGRRHVEFGASAGKQERGRGGLARGKQTGLDGISSHRPGLAWESLGGRLGVWVTHRTGPALPASLRTTNADSPSVASVARGWLGG